MIWDELSPWTMGLLAVVFFTALGIWGNLIYEGFKSLFNLEETFVSKKSAEWNSAKTSALFLSFLVVVQAFTLYNIIHRAAEPLLDDERIDHWLELYHIEETLEHLDRYDEEERYIRRQISGFIERGIMESGLFIFHLGLLLQSIYRGNREIRLTEKGLYTHEGKRRFSKIASYRTTYNPTEDAYQILITPEVKKVLFWESGKVPKKTIFEIDRKSLEEAEEMLRLEDVEKEDVK